MPLMYVTWYYVEEVESQRRTLRSAQGPKTQCIVHLKWQGRTTL